LCNRFKVLTLVGGADTLDQCLGRQEARRFPNRPLALHPPRCHRIEPQAFAGQLTDDQATAACALDALIVGCEPLPHDLPEVPGGIIPAQASRLRAVLGETVGAPGPRVTGDVAHGPPGDQAPQPGVGLREAEPGTRQGFTVRGRLGRFFFHEAAGLVRRPRGPGWWGPATPPDCVLAAQRHGGLPHGPAEQAVAPVFLRPEAGAGLVIQCVARCQGAPNRRRAARLVGALQGWERTPTSQQTAANHANVHGRRGVPNVRGL